MKARRFFTVILSLAYIVFLILCAYSPAVQTIGRIGDSLGQPGGLTGQHAPAQTAESGSSPAPALPASPANVKLEGGRFPANTEELTVVLQPGETELLEQFTTLRRADFSGSTNYDEIIAWAAKHPGVDVSYTVTLPNGSTVSNKTETLARDGMSPEQLFPVLATLPQVKELSLGSFGADFSLDELKSLQIAFPHLKLSYGVPLLGQTFTAETDTLDLSTASAADIDAAIAALPALPGLKTVLLGAEGNSLTTEQLQAIAEACPDAVLDYRFRFWGVDVNLSDSALNLSHIPINDEGVSLLAILPMMRNCVSVDADSCGISDDAMIYIRSLFPQMDIVWRVWFGTNYSVRTDVEKILASKPSQGGMITDADTKALGCCTKLKYLDIGHNGGLYDGSFLGNFPDLRVLILSQTSISDISALANCPHLEYLEIQHTSVSDISVLANAKELRHLNIGDSSVSDISPLFGLTEMERLYICAWSLVPEEQADYMRSVAPNCEVNTTQDKAKPDEGQWRYSDHVPAEAYIKFAQNGYVGFPFEYQPRYELLREQFGYDNAEYAFSWLDPLY